MEPVKTEAYFYNPGMTPRELEDWLSQQQHAVKCYNSLMREKPSLLPGFRKLKFRKMNLLRVAFQEN